MNTTNKTQEKNFKKNVLPTDGQQSQLFDKENYKWMLIGFVIVLLGFFLMAGGKSDDPNVFNDDAIYGFQRITLAPILIVGGLVVEIYAIMKKRRA